MRTHGSSPLSLMRFSSSRMNLSPSPPLLTRILSAYYISPLFFVQPPLGIKRNPAEAGLEQPAGHERNDTTIMIVMDWMKLVSMEAKMLKSFILIP